MRKRTRWHGQQKSVFRSNVDLRIGGANNVNADEKPTHNGIQQQQKKRNNSHSHKTIKLNCMLFLLLEYQHILKSFSAIWRRTATKKRTINGKLKHRMFTVYVLYSRVFSAFTMPTENKVMKMERFWWNQITISQGISIFEKFFCFYLFM